MAYSGIPDSGLQVRRRQQQPRGVRGAAGQCQDERQLLVAAQHLHRQPDRNRANLERHVRLNL